MYETTGSGLQDRIVVVTGGSRGLGRAMALTLAQAGARVAVIATGDSRPLQDMSAQMAAFKPAHEITFIFGDLRVPEDCERMARELKQRLRRVDVLVNNAGIPNIGAGSLFWEVTPENWFRTVETNVNGIFLLTRELAPGMVAQGFGRIVNVSTSASTMVRRMMSPYGPSKAFVEAATRIMAQDLEGTGVTANVLLPGGAVDTQVDLTGVKTVGRTFLSSNVMGPPLLWLASDLSSSHNGQRFIASMWDESEALAVRIQKSRDPSVLVPQIM